MTTSKTAFLHSIIIQSQNTQKHHVQLQKNQTYKRNITRATQSSQARLISTINIMQVASTTYLPHQSRSVKCVRSTAQA